MNSDLTIDEYMIEIENNSKLDKLPKIESHQQKFSSWASENNSNNFMDEVDQLLMQQDFLSPTFGNPQPKVSITV